MTDDLERRFLLVKRGLYYAPDNHGYTGIKERAGRYLESDASPDHGVTAIHEDEAPDYSPACFHDIAHEHLQGKVDRLRAENEALREALGPFAKAAEDLDDTTPDRCSMWEHHVSIDVEAGDFRRAAAAIRTGEAEQ